MLILMAKINIQCKCNCKIEIWTAFCHDCAHKIGRLDTVGKEFNSWCDRALLS
jgi:hypothetical protein